MIGRLLSRLLLALPLLALAALVYIDRTAPLDPLAPPTILTPIQIRLMALDPGRCTAALRRAGLDFTPASRPRRNGCGFDDGVRLSPAAGLSRSSLVLRCPAAVALVMWERHVVEPAARRHFAENLRGIRSLGTYACRNVNGRGTGRRSQHASANAIDIAGFTLGTVDVSVERDWNAANPKDRFLKEVRQGACGLFGTVLSPDYNALHRNHLHLDMAPWRVCR